MWQLCDRRVEMQDTIMYLKGTIILLQTVLLVT